MNVEHEVLGCVIRDNRVYRDAALVINGDDFENPAYGAVFDAIGRTLATGGRIDVAALEGLLPSWEVRGIDPTEPWVWIDAAPAPSMVHGAAVTLRARSLRRRGTQVMRQALVELAEIGNDPAAILEKVNRELVGDTRAELDSVPLTDVLNTPDDANWVIPGLLEAKDRLILTGHEGLGKTTLVRQMLILPAAGIHPLTFDRIDPVTALVVDAENTAKQWMRATRWMVGRAESVTKQNPAANVHMALSGRLDILNPATLGGIHRLIDRHNPGIVFIGPLYRIAVNLNTDEQVAPVIAALDSIRDRGVALVIEAHAGHAIGVGGVRDVRPRGSSALLGWPEFGFGIRKDTTEAAGPGLFDFVAWRGAREQRDWPEQLRRGVWEAGEWPWVPVGSW